jgi:hypothetical protein
MIPSNTAPETPTPTQGTTQPQYPAPKALYVPTRQELTHAAAKELIALGYAIFPLNELGKAPLSYALDKHGNRRLYNGIHSAYSASYGPMREYTTPKTGAKKLWTTTALASWEDGITSNPAIALELSGLAVMDIDGGIDCGYRLKEFMVDFGIPITKCVKSGRTSSFGAHLHFVGVVPSGDFSIPWRGGFVTGEIKSDAPRYVAAEGSFHKSGLRYVRIWDLPLEPTPVALFADILAKYPNTKKSVIDLDAASLPFDGDSVTCEQFEAWCENVHEEFSGPFLVIHRGQKAYMYVRLSGCPFDEKDLETTGKHLHKGDNGDGDFVVFLPLEGKIAANCVHTSCKSAWAEPGCWKSYRKLADPDNKFSLQPGASKGTVVYQYLPAEGLAKA